MSENIWKLPLYTLVAGILLRLANYITVVLLMTGNEWTLEMGTTAFFIDSVLSVAMLVGIGLLLRRRYSPAVFFKATTLLVLYFLAILAIEQIAQRFGFYNILIYHLFAPVEVFTFLTSLLARVSGAQSINWLYALPAAFAPYLLLLFCKREKAG